MNVNEVIKSPILTEKTHKQMSNNVYTFAVDKRTNKAEVKKVVEYIFDVKVEKVNIMLIGKKPKKLGRFEGFVPGYKKAIIKLAKGYSISIFPDENPQTTSETKEKIKEVKIESKKDDQKAKDLEQKVAEKLAKAKLKKITKSNVKKPKNDLNKDQIDKKTKEIKDGNKKV